MSDDYWYLQKVWLWIESRERWESDIGSQKVFQSKCGRIMHWNVDWSIRSDQEVQSREEEVDRKDEF